MKLELKPCPFCGGEAVLLKMGSGLAPQTVGFGKYGNSIICKSCKAETNEFRSRIETIKSWNNRNHDNFFNDIIHHANNGHETLSIGWLLNEIKKLEGL